MTTQLQISIPADQAGGGEVRVTTSTDGHMQATYLQAGDSITVHVHSENDVRACEVPAGTKASNIQQTTRATDDAGASRVDQGSEKPADVLAPGKSQQALADVQRLGADIEGAKHYSRDGVACSGACESRVLQGGDFHPDDLRAAVHDSMARADSEERKQHGMISGELAVFAVPPASAEAHRQALEHAAMDKLAASVLATAIALHAQPGQAATPAQLGQHLRAGIDALLGLTVAAGAQVIDGDLQVNGTVKVLGDVVIMHGAEDPQGQDQGQPQEQEQATQASDSEKNGTQNG